MKTVVIGWLGRLLFTQHPSLNTPFSALPLGVALPGLLLSSFISSVPARAVRIALDPAVVQPGDSFLVTVTPRPEEQIVAIRATVAGERPTFNPFGRVWQAVAAVNVKTLPGNHRVYVKVTLQEGREVGDTALLTVRTRHFPRQALRVSPQKAAQRTQAALQRDYAVINPALAHSSPRPWWDGPFLQPVQGRVSTEYGVIRTINGKEGGRHYGVDIVASAGTPVRASHHGRVVLAASLEVHGNTVIIDHGCGVFSLYLHLRDLRVQVGQQVTRGQPIGTVGSTGFVTGPHLHWGIKVGSVSARPWNWMENPPMPHNPGGG